MSLIHLAIKPRKATFQTSNHTTRWVLEWHLETNSARHLIISWAVLNLTKELVYLVWPKTGSSIRWIWLEKCQEDLFNSLAVAVQTNTGQLRGLTRQPWITKTGLPTDLMLLGKLLSHKYSFLTPKSFRRDYQNLLTMDSTKDSSNPRSHCNDLPHK